MGSELLPLGPVGSWAGVGGGGGGFGGEHDASEGLPSILDAIPAWKRPRLLKGLQERETEYTTVEGVGVFIGTWNVNAKKPNFDDPLWLHEWLCPAEGPEGKERSSGDASSAPPAAAKAGNAESVCAETSASEEGNGMEDVYAIGFQELVDLNAVNVAVDIKSQKRSVEWEERVLSSLNLAALHQANKRRRRASETPLVPRSSATTGGAQEKGASDTAKETVPPDGTTQQPPDFLNDDDVLDVVSVASLAETDNGLQQDEGVEVGISLPHAAASDTATSPSATERDNFHRDEPSKSHGPASLGDAGGVSDEGTTFVLVAKEHLVGTWLAVFVRASMLKQVSDVRSATVSAGMMGVMGNKGGVGIRLRLRDSSLCFVSSHLAAHRENIKARNENYQKILREMVFQPLPGAEWRRPQQQPQRRMNSFRGGGSSPPTSPGTRRRLSVTTRLMNPLGGGGASATVGRGRASESGPGSLNYRRKLSVAAPSLSGILSPRHKPNGDSSFASTSSKRTVSSSCSPKRTAARDGDTDASCGCLSLPTSPDYTKQRQARHQQRVQRGRAASFCRELSPLQDDGSRGRRARPRRRNSMCMSWSGASFTSVMPSASSYSAASCCPPPPPAKQTPPIGQRELQSLPPALAITVASAPSITAVGAESTSSAVAAADRAGQPLDRNVSDDDWPSASDDGSSSSDSAGGSPTAASVGAPPSSANSASAIAAFEMRRLNTAVAIDDLCGNATTGDGQTKPVVVGGHEFTGGAGGDGSTVASLLRMGDGETETLPSGVLGRGTAIGAEGGFGGGDGSARVRSNAVLGGGGQGGPTQVLFVPEITTHNTGEHLGIQDHDVVFWFGDLNYRIESSIAALEVLAHAVSGGVSFLAANDQLNSAREAGDAFRGFHEAPIDFPPTYKYAAGTDDYDTRNDKKFRAPAWCDRILFWTSGGDNGTDSTVPKDVKTVTAGSVRQHAYRRSETPLTSDHKPVSASFWFGCKQVDSDIYSKVLLDVVKKVTRAAGDVKPQVDIVEGGNAMDFGDVQYGVPQTRSVWIANTGRVPATFSVHSSQHPVPKNSSPDRPRSPLGSDDLRNLEAKKDHNESDTEEGKGIDDLFGPASSCSPNETGEGGGGAASGGRKQDDNSGGKEILSDEGGKEQEEVGEGAFSPASGSGGEVTPAPAAVEDTSKWCSVSPEQGVLLPGERLEVKFTLLVFGLAGRALATGRMSSILDDIHVLRVERGSDRYIAVSGNYEASVYGSTLPAMMSPKPISATLNSSTDAASNVARGGGLYEGRRIGTGDDEGARRHEGTAAGAISGSVTVPLVDADAGREDGAGARMSSGQKTVRIPRQVWRMVDALLKDSHYDQPGLLVDKGNEQEILGIRAAVNAGAEFPPHCANSMVEALVTLLGSLSSSVIPESAWAAVSEAVAELDAEERASALMGGMPTLNRDVFEYLSRCASSLLFRRT
ncbi:conserved unknown protein [Ectocarpus siliculosus]|uniref:Inositol polyphosphate-related phosphatase domain-containing protein n=1 Tax=Ectocarpus siliculosus TaxID=2880 RepID=D7FKN8_ECTSI|nr:conserved unknown protein [Ectocarpus siliculosus]|eukprot:CBJ29438.1 conserved unknown protein [Ectocarpus siliculosus]